MIIKTGLLLQSHSESPDDYFYKAIIYIAEHNSEGSTGFIINRLFPRKLNELHEFSYLPRFPLYEGGPVSQSHLYFVHRCPDVIKDGVFISDNAYLGGNFKQAVAGIAQSVITTNNIIIFVGYCGWDINELEAETEAGEWSFVNDKLFL